MQDLLDISLIEPCCPQCSLALCAVSLKGSCNFRNPCSAQRTASPPHIPVAATSSLSFAVAWHFQQLAWLSSLQNIIRPHMHQHQTKLCCTMWCRVLSLSLLLQGTRSKFHITAGLALTTCTLALTTWPCGALP